MQPFVERLRAAQWPGPPRPGASSVQWCTFHRWPIWRGLLRKTEPRKAPPTRVTCLSGAEVSGALALRGEGCACPRSPARSDSALSLPAVSIRVDWPLHHHPPPDPGHGASFLALVSGSSSCLCAGRGPGLVGQHSPTLLPSCPHPDLLCLPCNLTGESLTCSFVPAGGPLEHLLRVGPCAWHSEGS